MAFTALTLLFMALGATAIRSFSTMEARARDLSSNYTLAIGHLGDMGHAVLLYRTALKEQGSATAEIATCRAR